MSWVIWMIWYVCPGQPDLQVSGNIVMNLLVNIPRHRGHKLSLTIGAKLLILLVTTLMNQAIALIGTVCAYRLTNCIMKSKKYTKKEGRATIAIKMCKSDVAELHAIKWFNNHAVSIMTIYKATEHKIKNMRYKGKRRVIFECPSTTAIWE